MSISFRLASEDFIFETASSSRCGYKHISPFGQLPFKFAGHHRGLDLTCCSSNSAGVDFTLPFPLPFLPPPLPFTRMARSQVRVDSAGRQRLLLKLSSPVHAFSGKESVNTFGQPLQCPPANVFSHPVNLHDVRLQFLGRSDLRQECISKNLFRNGD